MNKSTPRTALGLPTGRVIDLQPGDEVQQADGSTAIFIIQQRHPIDGGHQMVVWKLSDGEWSHDSLSPIQVVGKILSKTHEERQMNLARALGRY